MASSDPGTTRQVSRSHGMSEQAEACRRKAAECERAVVLATRPDVKAIYRDLARQWQEMAEHSENLERWHSNSRLPSVKSGNYREPPSAERPDFASSATRDARPGPRP
jgi:hypothetical protein